MTIDRNAERPGPWHVLAHLGLFGLVAMALFVAVGLGAPVGVLMSIMAVQLVGMVVIAWLQLRAWNSYFKRRYGKGLME